MRKPILFGVASLIHWGLSYALLFASLGSSLSRFESGTAPTLGSRVIEMLNAVLLYPVFIPVIDLLRSGTPAAEHALLLVNSLVWGGAIVGLVHLVGRDRGVRKVAAV